MSEILIPGRFVVCAACMYDNGLIIAGARHFDLVMQTQLRFMKEQDEIEFANRGSPVQGFIDQKGVFMDRKEALAVAIAANQVNVRRTKTWPEDELFSEDLY